jgi:SAM-dependent methyltransferase
MTYPRIERLHPEMGAGGFTAYDGTVAFYARVGGLVDETSTVLDFGAGRAAWAHDDPSKARRKCRWLKGRVAKIIGSDVDPAVLENPAVDEAVVVDIGKPLPFGSGTFDLIIADYVVEHIEDPTWFAREIERLLKPGGWFCGRTPSKYHYVALASGLVPEALHARVLRRAQSERQTRDVFPTHYRLNTQADVKRHFPVTRFTDHSYIYSFEPQYHFGRPLIYRAFKALHWLLPRSMTGNMFLFVRKTELGAVARSELAKAVTP